MRLETQKDIQLDVDNIITATYKSQNEIIFLADGKVQQHKIAENNTSVLFSIPDTKSNKEEQFDSTAPSSIYLLGNAVVVVNDYKQIGYIHNPPFYDLMEIKRGDYHMNISQYPIALYDNKDGIPHLIYAEDWNHLQILNLNTLQVLTADKSLITEYAEEEHLKFIDKNFSSRPSMWPSTYDYFYGKILVSPNSEYFLSMGWYWGSADGYNVYDVNNFLTSNRIADIPVIQGEHINRPACWVDDNTLVTVSNPYLDSYEEEGYDASWNLQFYRITEGRSALIKEVPIDIADFDHDQFHYNKELNIIICISPKTGVVFFSLEGKVLYRNESLLCDHYSHYDNSLISVYKNIIKRYKIVE